MQLNITYNLIILTIFFIAANNHTSRFLCPDQANKTFSAYSEKHNMGSISTSEVNKELLLRIVNDARQKGCYCGDEYYIPTTPLIWNDALEYAALTHCIDMISNDFFNHTGYNGSNPGDRITGAGYVWYSYGENISFGRRTEEEVIAGWLASPGHCKNIMNPMFKEMGVARSGNYWTQVLASKRVN